MPIALYKSALVALTSVAQSAGQCSTKQKVAGSIPGEAHTWVAGSVPGWGVC